MSHLRRLSPLLVLAFAACGDDTYYGSEEPADDSALLAQCPDDAPTLGAPGTTTTLSVPVDWREQGRDAVLAEPLYFVLPDDVLSLGVSIESGDAWTSVRRLALDGELLLSPDEYGPPFYHGPVEVGTIGLPMNAVTYPQPGCLAIDGIAYDTDTDDPGIVRVVTRRGAAAPSTIDLNVVIVGDTDISDEELDAALDRMGEVYAATGELQLGNVDVWELEWDDIYVDAEGADPSALRAAFTGDLPLAVTLYFIQDFNEVGTLGIAAGTPGPNGVEGTAASGVILSVDTHLDGDGNTLLTSMLGETMAHEVGHQLGLFHTSEADGAEHDGIADTPQCGVEYDADGDGELTAEECVDAGGRNFMFWTAGEFAQADVSPTQAAVLRDNVVAYVP